MYMYTVDLDITQMCELIISLSGGWLQASSTDSQGFYQASTGGEA